MTLLKYVQVVVSDWIAIAICDRDASSPPRLRGRLRTWLRVGTSLGDPGLCAEGAAVSLLPRLREGCPARPARADTPRATSSASEDKGLGWSHGGRQGQAATSCFRWS